MYNKPHLLVYGESAMEIYDVLTAKWIQTIPLKKVTALFWLDSEYPHPFAVLWECPYTHPFAVLSVHIKFKERILAA